MATALLTVQEELVALRARTVQFTTLLPSPASPIPRQLVGLAEPNAKLQLAASERRLATAVSAASTVTELEPTTLSRTPVTCQTLRIVVARQEQPAHQIQLVRVRRLAQLESAV